MYGSRTIGLTRTNGCRKKVWERVSGSVAWKVTVFPLFGDSGVFSGLPFLPLRWRNEDLVAIVCRSRLVLPVKCTASASFPNKWFVRRAKVQCSKSTCKDEGGSKYPTDQNRSFL